MKLSPTLVTASSALISATSNNLYNDLAEATKALEQKKGDTNNRYPGVVAVDMQDRISIFLECHGSRPPTCSAHPSASVGTLEVVRFSVGTV